MTALGGDLGSNLVTSIVTSIVAAAALGMAGLLLVPGTPLTRAAPRHGSPWSYRPAD